MNEYVHGVRMFLGVLFFLLGIVCASWAWASLCAPWAPWLYMAAGWMFRSAIARRYGG